MKTAMTSGLFNARFNNDGKQKQGYFTRLYVIAIYRRLKLFTAYRIEIFIEEQMNVRMKRTALMLGCQVVIGVRFRNAITGCEGGLQNDSLSDKKREAGRLFGLASQRSR